ncbi:MAG: glycosyltransferase [Patescibacteria group bacterium]
MKILILSPNQSKKYNRGHQLFRNEIGVQHPTIYYGSGYPNYNPNLSAKEIIKSCYKTDKPDIILTYGYRYTKQFRNLGEITNIVKIHFEIDYFPPTGKYKGVMAEDNIMIRNNKYDLIFGVVGRVVKHLKENKICDKIFLLPFSVDTNIYKPLNVNKDIDVLAAFTTRDDVYPNRNKIHRMLNKMKITKITGKVIHQHLIRSINRSRIVITSNNIFNSLSMRYTETLGCGGFLLADRPEDFDELGYVDGKHLVLYKDINDLKEKILFCLQKPKFRKFISKNGYEFVTKNHSNIVRVKQFTDIISREFGIK